MASPGWFQDPAFHAALAQRGVVFEARDRDWHRCEDVDLAYRIFQLGYRLVFAPEAVVYHRNERTFAGLFGEGFVHGVYSVQAIKKHSAFLAGYGHRSFSRYSYAAIGSAVRDYRAGRDRERSLCFAVFNSAKKLGKVVGSIRFRHSIHARREASVFRSASMVKPMFRAKSWAPLPTSRW